MVKRSRPALADAPLSRRRLLHAGGLGAVGLLACPGIVLARTSTAKSLAFHNLHTGESVKVEFWLDGQPVPEALREINYVLRDHRSNEVKEIDIDLLHLLHRLKGKLEARRAYQVISGYRSPATNALLRKKSGGVAKKSFHMKGMAIDIALPGCDLCDLRQAALELKSGGVGYYPKPGFVHVDTGPPRQWS